MTICLQKLTPPKPIDRRSNMGLVYADIELLSGEEWAASRSGRLAKKQVKRERVRALVDTGAYMLVINERLKRKLRLKKVGEEWAELADGSRLRVNMVGPLEVRFENRRAN